MEAVGPQNLGTFFEKCDELLTPDGMMLHHTIGSNEWKTHTDPWFDKYIFPGGVLPSLGQIARATEKAWSIEDVHNFGPDYDRTLMEWHRRIGERWEKIPSLRRAFPADVGVLPAWLCCRFPGSGDAVVSDRVHEGEAASSRLRRGAVNAVNT